jgi:hypothetical protein
MFFFMSGKLISLKIVAQVEPLLLDVGSHTVEVFPTYLSE